MVAIVDYLVSQGRAYAANIAQQLAAGSVQFHAHAVDAADHYVFEALLQHFLVDIVLVLSHPDAFRVYLDQLAQRVHQAPSDADGPTDCDIVVRKFPAGHFGSAVHRGPVLADHDGDKFVLEVTPLDHFFGLAACGAVADGDGLDMKGFYQGLQFGYGGPFFAY